MGNNNKTNHYFQISKLKINGKVMKNCEYSFGNLQRIRKRETYFPVGEKVTEEENRSCYNKATKNKTPNKKTEVNVMKYVCDVCGWEYDEELGCPEKGIAPGTKWEDIPEDFECPLCFVGKDQFSEA